MAYKNVFFDLDRTLWDFQKNSEQTLLELTNRYFPNNRLNFSEFLDTYYRINEALWVKYRNGEITKQFLRTTRFKQTFNELNVETNGSICDNISEDYIIESPIKTIVFPGTFEVLTYLKDKGYRLFLITNGFKEVQVKKIKHSKLENYFEKMITSDEAGYQKPDKRIFEHALKSTNSKKTESLMIGDDLDTDIAGAHAFGMDCIYFNPENSSKSSKATYEIKNLLDIISIL